MMAMNEPVRIQISPFCGRLRSKKYYFLKAPPIQPSDILDASGHCWCQRTMGSVGPDGRLVDPETCRAGRRCFEPIGPKA